MTAADHVQPPTRAAWRAWLRTHHARPAGVWLVTFKKSAGQPTIPYDEAVEEALCFGWVDSRPGKVDAERTKLYFAPRNPGSGWSRPNKLRVGRATAAGRMHPSGQAVVDAAKADNSWAKLDAVEELVVPPDLAAGLAARPPAATHFAAFPRSVRRGILEWVLQAKRPETRAKRIATTAELAAANRRANQWRPAPRDGS